MMQYSEHVHTRDVKSLAYRLLPVAPLRTFNGFPFTASDEKMR